MVWLKIVMSIIWILILSTFIAAFIQGLIEGKILWIRVSIGGIALSMPTLIAIFKSEKN